MRKILFTLLLLSLPVMIKATGQMAERLLINGKYWQLYYCPIETDMALSEEIAKAIESLPETITEDSIEWVKDQSTDLWRNYIAEWEIKDNRLFLRKIGVPYIREVGNRLEDHFFTLNEEKLKELFTGKTGITDHSMRSKDQSARIFRTWIEADSTKKTDSGEAYTALKARAYMLKTEGNADLIKEIDGGIKKEVSVSCSAEGCICSICGKDLKKRECKHIKGRKSTSKVIHLHYKSHIPQSLDQRQLLLQIDSRHLMVGVGDVGIGVGDQLEALCAFNQNIVGGRRHAALVEMGNKHWVFHRIDIRDAELAARLRIAAQNLAVHGRILVFTGKDIDRGDVLEI